MGSGPIERQDSNTAYLQLVPTRSVARGMGHTCPAPSLCSVVAASTHVLSTAGHVRRRIGGGGRHVRPYREVARSWCVGRGCGTCTCALEIGVPAAVWLLLHGTAPRHQYFVLLVTWCTSGSANASVKGHFLLLKWGRDVLNMGLLVAQGRWQW